MKLDSLERSWQLVADARKRATEKGESLAVWQLRLYDDILLRQEGYRGLVLECPIMSS